jgi:hypothetical protein
MYKYSKEVKNRFFERPWFSFLFVWFARNKNSTEFAEGKFKKNKDKNLTERMKKEMVLLGDEAMGILVKQENSSKFSKALLEYAQKI